VDGTPFKEERPLVQIGTCPAPLPRPVRRKLFYPDAGGIYPTPEKIFTQVQSSIIWAGKISSRRNRG